MTPLKRVKTRLLNLTPSTFEELIRDAIAEITGIPVRRAKSGFQAGRDGSWSNPLPAMVECKRYTDGNNLSDRDLLGELLMAHRQGCDLWVLAATCRVSDQTVGHLEAGAADLGLTAKIMDWRETPFGGLPALLAAAPQTTRRYLGAVAEPLLQMAAGEAVAAIDSLRQELSSPAISMEQLRRRLSERLTASMADPLLLAADFGGRSPASIPGAHAWSGFVPRVKAESELAEWWEAESHLGVPAVLLGDEGVGKSLTALRWLEARARDGVIVFPVTSQFALPSDDPFDIMAAVLVRLFGEQADRWRKRLVAYFSKGPQSTPQALIYFDGINERPDAPWAGLLKALQARPFPGTVAVLSSCRPWPYTHRFSGFPGLARAPNLIELGIFDDSELSVALQLHGRRPADFPTEMLPLLARPRLFALALRNEAAMRAAGEYTPSRLFWEDWLDRLAAGRAILNAQEYRKALSFLAEAMDRSAHSHEITADPHDMRAAIDRAQVVPQGRVVQEQTFSEIIDGGLARLDSDLALRLSPTFVAFALGLHLRFVLVQRARRGAEESPLSLRDFAKTLLEPWGGADFGASVARFAAWAGVELDDTPDAVRSAIFALWLSEQNFAESHEEDAAAIVNRRPQIALDAADDLWFRGTSDAAVVALQRALETAVSPEYRNGAVREEVKRKARQWAGTIGLGRGFTRFTSTTPENHSTKRLAALRREAGRDVELHVPFEMCGESLCIVEPKEKDGEAAAGYALDTLMATAKTDLAPLVRATAVASAYDSRPDLVEVCLRLTRGLDVDDLELLNILRAEILNLKSFPAERAKEAAAELAFMLDLPDPDVAADTQPKDPVIKCLWSAVPFRVKPVLDAAFAPNPPEPGDLMEWLLEPDAELTSEFLNEIHGHVAAPTEGLPDLDLEPTAHAAAARGLIEKSTPKVNSPEPIARRDADEVPVTSNPEKYRSDEVLKLLDGALSNEGTAAAASWDRLVSALSASGDRPQIPTRRLVAAKIHRTIDGRNIVNDRHTAVLNGHHLACLLRSNVSELTQMIDRLLKSSDNCLDSHLELRPGLIFGALHAALLLQTANATEFWEKATQDWADFVLVPDPRWWYFDMIFDTPATPRCLELRKCLLDRVNEEEALLGVVCSARHHKCGAWLESEIAHDLASPAPWRNVRGLLLTGMAGGDVMSWRAADERHRSRWFREIRFTAFRYASREKRMRYWLGVVATASDANRALEALEVLRHDADRRLHLLIPEFILPEERREWIFGLTQDLELTRSGRLLEHYLAIPPHTWLGPPGSPRKWFQ